MSEIAEIRKLFQDLIAPDLKAIQVKQELLEKNMNERFSMMEKSMSERLTGIEKIMDERLAALHHRLGAVEAVSEARHVIVLAKFDMLEKMLDIDRRLQRVEERDNPSRPAA